MTDRNTAAAEFMTESNTAATENGAYASACHIRPMTHEDAKEAARIDHEIFSEPWSEKGFISSLESPYTRYLVVECDGQIAGYCGYLRSFEEADITNVAVVETMRQKGIARAMLIALMEEGRAEGIERFTLEVRESNVHAIHLYESLGFHTEGVRKNFYRLPTENALIMWTDPIKSET